MLRSPTKVKNVFRTRMTTCFLATRFQQANTADRIFELLDTGNNSSLGLPEVRAFVAATIATGLGDGKEEEIVQEAWAELNRNGDSKVSQEEWARSPPDRARLFVLSLARTLLETAQATPGLRYH